MKRKILLSSIVSVLIIVIAIGLGSVYIAPWDIIKIISHKVFFVPISVDVLNIGLVWNIRLPRVLIAFLVGGSLAVCGSVMQSVLKNPLASTYGLGVSSGAGLGVALLIISSLTSAILTPLVALVFGIATVIFVICFSNSIDKDMSNNTIILTGMVISLFINAILTTIAAMFSKHSQKILLWQLGSFALKKWSYVAIMFLVLSYGIIYFMRFSRELDILTFGEKQASIMGVDTKKIKWIFIIICAILTGFSVAFVGIIGFVDLIAPHIVRKVFGANHKYVVPMSALFGGSFMVVCDLISRTVISPSEIPIGSVTALIGAPFFIYMYFQNKKGINK